MTLSTTTSQVSYSGDGATTSFSIPFLFLVDSHVAVTHRDADGVETEWTNGTQYTLSGAGIATGGTLTIDTSPTDYTPASGETLVIRRVVPETQETDYPEGGAFPAAAHEQALDKLTMLVQQHSEEIGRSIKVPVTDTGTDTTLASTATRASKSFDFDSSGGIAYNPADDDSSNTATASGATTSLSHAERFGQMYNAMDFGATGDGTTDDTTALQAAITAAAGNKPLYLPKGTYKITAELDASGSSALKMFGAGVNASIISQHTDNLAILKVGTGGPHIADMQLRYNDAQGIANTGANAIEFYGTNYGVFERLNLYRCNRGMYVPQEAVVSGANYLFSCSIRDIFVSYYSNNGMDLTGYNAGISGNVMSNIYLLGRDDVGTKLETNAALELGAWGNGVLNQINVESSKPTEAMYFNTCDGLVLNAIHFEQVECRTDFGGLMDFAGGSHVVNNVQVEYCQISVTNLLALVRASAVNTKVRVTGIEEENNTVTATHWRTFLLPGTETDIELYADLVRANDFTSEGFSASYPSAIRQFGTKLNVLDLGGNSIISATAVPSTGTWVTGDKAFNSAPASGEPLGWVCTSGGSPGTWQAFGVLEGLTSYDGNSAQTLTAGLSAPTALIFGTLTADRAITLSGGFKGAKFRIARTAAGAFNTDVGGLKNLAASEWCDVEHDGSSWVLTAFGGL